MCVCVCVWFFVCLFVCLFVCFCNRRRCGNVFCLFPAIFACALLNCSLFANDAFIPSATRTFGLLLRLTKASHLFCLIIQFVPVYPLA